MGKIVLAWFLGVAAQAAPLPDVDAPPVMELLTDGERVLYRIVGPDETDGQRGWISIDAPLARAMLKKRVDDEFDAVLPGGIVHYAIVGIRYSD